MVVTHNILNFMLLLLGSIASATLILLVYLLTRRKGELPGPSGWPIVGSLFPVLKNPTGLHTVVEQWADQYGPLFEVTILGTRVVLLADLEVTQQIFQNRPNGWRRIKNLEPTARSIGVHGVFSSEGSDWKRQRKLTAPAFTSVKVKGHYETITLVCNRLKNKWLNAINNQKNPEEGIVIDVLPDMMSFTLDIISIIAFGYDLNSVEKYSDTVDCLLSVLPFMHQRLTTFFPYWKFYHTAIDKKFFKSMPKVKQLVIDIIEKYQNDRSNEASKNFIEVILQARQAGEDNLSDQEIFGNAITLLLAGQDTTANTLSWCMHYLSRNHKIQNCLFDETTNFISDPSRESKSWYLPERNQVDNLNFTLNVIKETLRIRSPSPLIFLSPTDTPQVVEVSPNLKTTVTPNEAVVITTRRLATEYFGKDFNPRIWESQDEKEIELLKAIANLPFGGGPRLCPGKHLSLFESTLFLSMLANNFIVRLESSNSTAIDESLAGTEGNIEESLEFTMGPKNLRARLFKRTND